MINFQPKNGNNLLKKEEKDEQRDCRRVDDGT